MSNKISLLSILCFFTLFSSFAVAQETAKKPLIEIAKPVRLGLPIDCDLGTDCWVMNYVDYGVEDNLQTDPNCAKRTYDSHKGTDFAILDEKAMINGVPVLSALDGTVSKVRDGEEDSWKSPEELRSVQDQRKECGNAVLIDNGQGVQTIYCHMKKGSIIVKKGQQVKKGDTIGLVGLSGFTEFPHIHLGLLKDGKIIDPYTGKHNAQKCGLNGRSLWDKELNLTYEPFTIMAAGFSDTVPALETVEKDATALKTSNPDINKLTFWGILLGVKENDHITLEIKDPNGKIFVDQHITQERDRARQFYFIGKNLENKPPLQQGVYTGTVRLTRTDPETGEESKDFLVETLLISE